MRRGRDDGAWLTVNRSQPSGSQNQAAALRAEGVVVTTGTLGELMVDFQVYGWFPRSLPSERGEESESEDDMDGTDGSGGREDA
jgi:methylated-DNA-protein-cysteine methyltransferase related protein